MTSVCADRARAVLSTVVRHLVPVADPATAETAKLFENTFRLVNIALAYQLHDLCVRDGLSTRAVVDAAATKPFGFLAHYPGAGVGGDCIPTGPHFLRGDAPAHERRMSLIRHASTVNNRRPAQIAHRAFQLVRPSAHVVLLGVAYKPGIADTCHSPAARIAAELARRGIEVCYVDPHVPEFTADHAVLARLPVRTFCSRDDLDLAILIAPQPEIIQQLIRTPPAYPILDCGDHMPNHPRANVPVITI